jgi:hypothetical protein
MPQEFISIFSLTERNIREPFDKAAGVALACAEMAFNQASNGVKAMEDGAALAGALYAVRDPREAARLQTDYARKLYEDSMSNAAKSGAFWIDLLKNLYPQPNSGSGA